MKVMFDTNVILDVFQNRQPHYHASAQCMNKVLAAVVEGWVPAHAVTTFYYVLAKSAGAETAREAVQWLVTSFHVAACDGAALAEACASDMADFEDAVVAISAARTGCSHLVTRNLSDYVGSPIPALSPDDLLRLCDEE